MNTAQHHHPIDCAVVFDNSLSPPITSRGLLSPLASVLESSPVIVRAHRSMYVFVWSPLTDNSADQVTERRRRARGRIHSIHCLYPTIPIPPLLLLFLLLLSLLLESSATYINKTSFGQITGLLDVEPCSFPCHGVNVSSGFVCLWLAWLS